MRKILFSLGVALLLCLGATAQKVQEYNASMFGIVSDGIQNNTGAIQYAIDFISQKGGGKLNFFVGRYLTGSLELKSNVTIELHEGAVLLASSNWNDYIPSSSNQRALLKGDKVTNFRLIGKGVVEGQPRKFEAVTKQLIDKGYIQVDEKDYPSLILLENCEQITIDGILFQQFVNKGLISMASNDIHLQNLTIRSQFPQTTALLLEQSTGMRLQHIYLETRAPAIIKDATTSFHVVEKCITANGKSAI